MTYRFSRKAADDLEDLYAFGVEAFDISVTVYLIVQPTRLICTLR